MIQMFPQREPLHQKANLSFEGRLEGDTKEIIIFPKEE